MIPPVERLHDHPIAAPGHLGDGFDRGLDVDANTAAWEGLPAVTRSAFEAFLAAEATAPLTFVVTGTDGHELRGLGAVEVFR